MDFEQSQNDDLAQDRAKLRICLKAWYVFWASEVSRSSETRPAGNCCPNHRQEIARNDRRPLTVATGYLAGVLIRNGCDRSTAHAYDGYGTFIRGMFVRWI